MCRKLGEICTCEFLDMLANRQTDKQTDMQRAGRNTSHIYRGRSNNGLLTDV